MLDINIKVIVHRLNVDPKFQPIKRKKRLFNPERYKAIKMKMEKHLEAGLIKEVYYLN